MLVILRGVNLNPGAEAEDMVALRLWVDEKRVISVRSVALLAAQDIRKDLLDGGGPQDAGWLVYSVANRLVDRMGPIVNELSDEVDGLDEELLLSGNGELRSRLLHIRREPILLRRYVAPQRDALASLYQKKNTRWFKWGTACGFVKLLTGSSGLSKSWMSFANGPPLFKMSFRRVSPSR